jgi:hypothetical protein
MTVRRAIGWSIVVFVVAAVACEDSARTALYWEDFESVCDGAPCGWERLRGDANQAIWVETLHAGEHGLALTGEVAVRGPGSETVEPVSAVILNVSVMGRCDAGSELEIDLALEDTFGASHIATAAPEMSSEWRPAVTTLLRFERSPPVGVVRVTQIGVRKTGRGSCEITDLVVDASTGIEPGC